MARDFLRQAACLCILVWLATARLFAAEVGDQVEFSRAGTQLQGRVVEIRPGGRFLMVESEIGGSRQQLVVVASGVRVVSSAGGSNLDSAMRMWSDQSAKFQVQASLVSQSATMATLRKADGRVVEVPIEKLSLADQEHLATLDSQQENPFAGGTLAPGTSSGSMNPVADGGGSELGQPSTYSPTQPLVFQRLEEAKELTADPCPYSFADLSPLLLPTGEIPFGSEVDRPLIATPDGSRVVYSVRTSRPKDGIGTKLYLADTSSRQSKVVGTLPSQVWLASADPASGDVLGIVTQGSDHRPSSLCVISGLPQGNPKVVAHWRMFPNDQGKQDYVRYRQLLPDKLAVTVYGGEVHVHDYAANRERWRAKTDSFNEPSVSPGGKYTALMAEEQCVILQTADGRQLGSIPNERGAGSLGFSPDATKLAVARSNSLSIFDVTTSEETLTHEASVPLAVLGKSVMWTGDDFLILPSGLLFSIPSNLIVWKYNPSKDAIEYTDLIHHGLLTFAERGHVGIVQLPHAAAVEQAGKSHSNLTALKSGDAISINVKSDAAGIGSNKISDWLSKALSTAGYQVASGAPTRLEVTIERGETKQRTYRNIGKFGSETVSFTPYTSKLQLTQSGQSIWQQNRTTSMPFFVHGGKSLQETAQDYEKPRPEFFQGVAIPKRILKREFQSGFGTSVVDGQGIR